MSRPPLPQLSEISESEGNAMSGLLNIFLTFAATSWMGVLFVAHSKVSFWGLSSSVCSFLLVLVPIVLSWISLGLTRFLSNDQLCHCKEVVLADHEFLPVYLGYFFVALGLDDTFVFLFTYLIVFVFTFFSQTQYFNPVFLLLRYHVYHVQTCAGTRVLVWAKGPVIRNCESAVFENVKRVNSTTYIARGPRR